MDAARKAIDAEAEGLKELNKKIHDNPELGYEEVKAHDNIVEYLRKLGFKVKPHAYGVSTSMEAEYGSGGRVVVFNAEYDSLPDIGHACGHNLIATASVAGFIGAAAALKASGKPGRVRLLGTPAEEGGGGKLKLIDAGAYMNVDATMMVHPGPFGDMCKGTTGAAWATSSANCKLYVTFHGRTAHAALAPWQGANALDAATLSYTAVSMLRQQIKPDHRIHSVISHGGDRPNVVPHFSKMNYYCRAPTLAQAKMLRHRVEACFRAAGLATNCHVEIEEQNTYFDLRPSKPLASMYAEEMEKIGSPVALDFNPDNSMSGSTDQGNVSYECPSIHPMFGIEAREGCYNHTPGFTAAAGTEKAFWQTIATAKGMAGTARKMLTDDKFAEEVKKEFEADQATLKKENGKVHHTIHKEDDEIEHGIANGHKHALDSDEEELVNKRSRHEEELSALKKENAELKDELAGLKAASQTRRKGLR